jgi:hypothetical protein
MDFLICESARSCLDSIGAGIDANDRRMISQVAVKYPDKASFPTCHIEHPAT